MLLTLFCGVLDCSSSLSSSLSSSELSQFSLALFTALREKKKVFTLEASGIKKINKNAKNIKI